MSAILEEISVETARALSVQAAASGLTVDGYLKRLLGVNGSAFQKKDTPKLDEVVAALNDLAEDVPPLPRNFSREDIYFPED